MIQRISRHFPFVPFIDIPVRLGNLVQRIAPVEDGSYLSRLDSLREERQIPGISLCRPPRGEKDPVPVQQVLHCEREFLPTASKSRSYAWPVFVKSSLV